MSSEVSIPLVTTRKHRLVVLISGTGSNLQAILDATNQEALKNAEVVLVVSNRADAFGLTRAKAANVPTLYFPLKPYSSSGRTREDYDRDLAQHIQEYAPDLIVCAGWMHILSPAFLNTFPNRVINLHPALPGVLAGKDSLRGTFEAVWNGANIPTGCMVHFVAPEVDAGQVIDVERVDVLPDDTFNTFASRMHEAEHRLIVRSVAKAIG
jgi:formyltetrahydrofolate-dependent phosphoribosylglycinamide formyltransferase